MGVWGHFPSFSKKGGSLLGGKVLLKRDLIPEKGSYFLTLFLEGRVKKASFGWALGAIFRLFWGLGDWDFFLFFNKGLHSYLLEAFEVKLCEEVDFRVDKKSIFGVGPQFPMGCFKFLIKNDQKLPF